jgi:transcription elongation factor GreA
MSTVTGDVVWMTPAALETLQQEIAELEAPARELDDQERATLVELKQLAQNAKAESKPDDGLVEPGMRVTVRFDKDGTEAEFIFGSRALLELDPSLQGDIYSPESPVGSAINGLHVGDTATINSPKGPRKLTIIKATPF